MWERYHFIKRITRLQKLFLKKKTLREHDIRRQSFVESKRHSRDMRKAMKKRNSRTKKADHPTWGSPGGTSPPQKKGEKNRPPHMGPTGGEGVHVLHFLEGEWGLVEFLQQLFQAFVDRTRFKRGIRKGEGKRGKKVKGKKEKGV